MKFRIKCTYANSDQPEEDAWWETYDKDIENPEEWARETVHSFNETLRPYEDPRTLLDVEVLDPDSKKDHTWIKTSLTMQRDHQKRRDYDEYECKTCGVTGQRYAISGPVRLDYKYRRSKVYHRCDTAQEHLEKHGHPKG